MKTYNRRNGVGLLLGVPFVLIGTQHFAQPDVFNSIVPAYLGWPSFWNYTSGAMEILFGIGMMIPSTRKYSARLLVVLVVLMSQANVNMWINDLPFNGTRMSTNGHILRLIIQLLLLTILLWLGEGIGQSDDEHLV